MTIAKKLLTVIAVALLLASVVGWIADGQKRNRQRLCDMGYAPDFCPEFEVGQ